jgi:hypothetical protein
VAVVFIWAADFKGLWSDELISYPVKCYDDPPSIPDCDKLYTLNRTHYEINKAVNEVSYVSLNDSVLGVRKLIRCAILDRENWTCSYPDASGTVQVIDGLKLIEERRAQV